MNNIEKIIIENLHGDISYQISMQNNVLILVAENGTGKTTIVNMIYCFLSRQWDKLSLYNFSSITVFFHNASPIKVSKDELSDFTKYRRLRTSSIRRHLSFKYKDAYETILQNYNIVNLIKEPQTIEKLADTYNLSFNGLYEMIQEMYKSGETQDLFRNQFREKENLLKRAVDAQILYLPTYRRIEQDLKTIFPHIEENIESFRRRALLKEDASNVYVELVEFGMEDVEQKLALATRELYNNFNNNLLSNITGSYLKDIINKKYLSYEFEQLKNLDVHILDIVLERIDKTILEDSEKEKLRAFVNELRLKDKLSNEDRVIAHFIYRLIEIYTDQRKKEKDIEDFVDICNTYLGSTKTFTYDPNNYKLIISLKNQKTINLRDLSSGEKQIVSLFSHLYLSNQKNFFLIIDEPELSLSVPWQKMLLPDIIKAKYCAGLLAVTHSPFIFNSNHLDNHTHGLEEFVIS